MNKKTQMWIGILAIAGGAYWLMTQKKKDRVFANLTSYGLSNSQLQNLANCSSICVGGTQAQNRECIADCLTPSIPTSPNPHNPREPYILGVPGIN